MATTAVYAWKPLGANQHGASALSAEPAKTTKELATAAGVGVHSIEQAKTVQTKAASEVVDTVKRREIGLPRWYVYRAASCCIPRHPTLSLAQGMPF